MAVGKILLVDDEEDFTRVLSQRLETRGLTVESVGNGIEALEKVQEESFDAIVLDMVMPGLDGIETLRRLRAINPDLQVILLTGRGDLKSGIEAMKLGAMDFLEKPADIKELMEKIGVARDQRIVLVEKENEERIRKLMGTKGW